jgi:hypothetical protein
MDTPLFSVLLMIHEPGSTLSWWFKLLFNIWFMTLSWQTLVRGKVGSAIGYRSLH